MPASPWLGLCLLQLSAWALDEGRVSLKCLHPVFLYRCGRGTSCVCKTFQGVGREATNGKQGVSRGVDLGHFLAESGGGRGGGRNRNSRWVQGWALGLDNLSEQRVKTTIFLTAAAGYLAWQLTKDCTDTVTVTDCQSDSLLFHGVIDSLNTG